MLLIVALSCTHADLERDTTVSIIDGNNPPTFKLDGNGDQIFFIVSEVAPENQGRNPYAKEDVAFWQVWPKEGTRPEVWLWPRIKYGTVPDGFVQKIPQNGMPPPLVEGKIYEAGGPASNAGGGYIWFEVRNRQIVRVPSPHDH